MCECVYVRTEHVGVYWMAANDFESRNKQRSNGDFPHFYIISMAFDSPIRFS